MRRWSTATLCSSALLAVAATTALLAVSVSAVAAAAADKAYLGDKVTSLPGAPPNLNFSMYSGYVTLPADQHTVPGKPKQLFYWLVEAEGGPAVADKAPLVLWLNGGPGCSSLAGLLSENGPFRVLPGGDKLEMRPERWNAAPANMLFLDSPAGVGFSTYSPTFSDDNTTAADSYAFLQGWLEKFPQYRTRDFFITGESYAGHYIPTLSLKIVQGNADKANKPINFRGFAVGNPTTNISTDFFWGTWRSWFANGLVSEPTWEGIQANCHDHWLQPVQACQNFLNAAQKEQGDINPYDINVPVCTTQTTTRGLVASPTQFVLDQLHGKAAADSAFPYFPCEDSYLTTYLNRADVKAALHVNASATYSQCTNINYNYTNFYDSMLPIYELFTGPKTPEKLSIWVYSGTADTVVPFLGTQRWVNGIFPDPAKNVVKAWHPWIVGGQVAGYSTTYENGGPNRFSFVTVKDAGHMVPQTKPAAGMTMFKAFLSGVPL